MDIGRRKPDWRDFPVLVLDFEFEMSANFILPPFAGSMFRGCLGWALKEVCSPDVYQYLFETSSDESGQSDATRPFLISPPVDQRQLRRGDRFGLGLHLFGKACDHVDLFVSAVRRMARVGLGAERAPFELCKIIVSEGAHRWVCFDRSHGWNRSYLPLPSALGCFLSQPADRPVRELEVDFCTPTRFVHRGQRVLQPPFHVLLRSALRRLDGLLRHHGGESLALNFPEQIRRAEEVETSFLKVQWADWERTSQRQSKRHIMGGVVGTARYRGEILPTWLEWLEASRVFHLGKATTFGMGAFRLRVTELQSILPAPPAIVRKTVREESPIGASA